MHGAWQFPWLQDGDGDEEPNLRQTPAVSNALRGQGVDEETQTEKILQVTTVHAAPSTALKQCLAQAMHKWENTAKTSTQTDVSVAVACSAVQTEALHLNSHSIFSWILGLIPQTVWEEKYVAGEPGHPHGKLKALRPCLLPLLGF